MLVAPLHQYSNSCACILFLQVLSQHLRAKQLCSQNFQPIAGEWFIFLAVSPEAGGLPDGNSLEEDEEESSHASLFST